jgi:hypothetical protein
MSADFRKSHVLKHMFSNERLPHRPAATFEQWGRTAPNNIRSYAGERTNGRSASNNYAAGQFSSPLKSGDHLSYGRSILRALSAVVRQAIPSARSTARTAPHPHLDQFFRRPFARPTQVLRIEILLSARGVQLPPRLPQTSPTADLSNDRGSSPARPPPYKQGNRIWIFTAYCAARRFGF